MSDLARDLHMGAAIGAFWGLSRTLSLLGDPSGRLETTDDLPALAASIREEPIVRTRGMRLSADYEACSAVLRSPDATADVPVARNLLQWVLIGPKRRPERISPLFDSIITKDGDAHARMRRLVQPAFTHRVMQSWREAAERVAAELVDALPGDRPVDLVAGWAAPLPMAVICEILGVPFADRARFRAWGEVLASGLDRPRSLAHSRRMDRASFEVTTYLAALLAQRRTDPSDDLLSTLALAESEGEHLSDRDIVATAAFIMLAGFETTVNLLGEGTHQVMLRRAQLADVLADHELVPGLVEEGLRYVSPVQYTFRTALAPIEVPGAEALPEGSTVILILAGANRDPRVFDDPDRFDVRRENARKHLALGFGVHHCLGAALARMEAEVAWRHLFERFPDPDAWRLAGEPVPTSGRMIRGLRTLPVRLGAPVRSG